ncbi:MAG: iron-sulfur cluster assembly accessory protein [Pirellulaceae bacterium]|jgi:iron-sulfur cluster assembly accessory protein
MALILTEKAADEVRRFKESGQIEQDMFLRVGVNAGGCSGFDYRLEFDNSYDDDADRKYEMHGVDVVVDKKSALLLDGTTIDFVEGLQQRGFKFENPNARTSCGCGKSFGV